MPKRKHKFNTVKSRVTTRNVVQIECPCAGLERTAGNSKRDVWQCQRPLEPPAEHHQQHCGPVFEVEGIPVMHLSLTRQ